MRKTNRICIFLFVLLGSLMMGLLLKGQTYEKELKEAPTTMDVKKTVPSSKNDNYKYIVIEEMGTLVIYNAKDNKKYLSTDIEMESLPEKVQQEVEEGLNFTDEKSLFDFLENYSS